MTSGADLQPLRIVHGWSIVWNTLSELDPTPENVLAFLFTSSSLLTAIHHQKGLLVDVAWMPPDDPDGRFLVEVYHVPVEIKKRPLASPPPKTVNYYRDGKLIHSFETRQRTELVAHLENKVFTMR
jgi:hypothetical protein